MMHCHLDNHHANGMALVLKEGTQEQIKSLVKLDEINTCYKGYEGNKLKFNKNEFLNVKEKLWIGVILGVLTASVFFNFILVIYGYSLHKRRAIASTYHSSISEKETKDTLIHK